ncbi:MAG: hypothetical protein QM576_06490, partial [Rhodopseudomonas sp.]|uniref:hypothetical protein n=1 Tax=Rhodopseudomonas sp. TaxID=1078 RepID=UPI0039E22862
RHPLINHRPRRFSRRSSLASHPGIASSPTKNNKLGQFRRGLAGGRGSALGQAALLRPIRRAL